MSYCAIIVENRPIPGLQKIIDDHMKFLPGWNFVHWSEQGLATLQDYNRLLTSERFWSKFQKYDRVLIFQHDSGILRSGINEFMDHSYYGAPWIWDKQHRPGGNGGLSLRCPKKSLNLVRRLPYNPTYGYEDVYFSHNMEDVAPYEKCKNFSVETVFQLGTFGYHAIDKYLTKEQVDMILKKNERK